VKVTRTDIEEFLSRDWALFERSEALHWCATKKRDGAEAALRMAAELRRQAIAAHPDWPTPDDRAADLAHHAAVAEMLARAARTRNS
jgi:hypothetical protein